MKSTETTVILTRRTDQLGYGNCGNTIVMAADIYEDPRIAGKQARIRHAGENREVDYLPEEEMRKIRELVIEVVLAIKKVITIRQRKSPLHIEETRKDERISEWKREKIIEEIRRDPDPVALYREINDRLRNTAFEIGRDTVVRIREVTVDGERFSFW